MPKWIRLFCPALLHAGLPTYRLALLRYRNCRFGSGLGVLQPCLWLCFRLSVCVSVRANTEAVESSWNVMAHGDAREGKWRGNWRMEWVVSTLHTTPEHGVSSITTVDTHTSAASSRMNWCPRRFKWTRPFRRKMKSGFCACAITFQLTSTISICFTHHHACHHPSRAVLFGARVHLTQGAYEHKRHRI